jgi:hypothetical protein
MLRRDSFINYCSENLKVTHVNSITQATFWAFILVAARRQRFDLTEKRGERTSLSFFNQTPLIKLKKMLIPYVSVALLVTDVYANFAKVPRQASSGTAANPVVVLDYGSFKGASTHFWVYPLENHRE